MSKIVLYIYLILFINNVFCQNDTAFFLNKEFVNDTTLVKSCFYKYTTINKYQLVYYSQKWLLIDSNNHVKRNSIKQFGTPQTSFHISENNKLYELQIYNPIDSTSIIIYFNNRFKVTQIIECKFYVDKNNSFWYLKYLKRTFYKKNRVFKILYYEDDILIKIVYLKRNGIIKKEYSPPLPNEKKQSSI